MGTHSGNGGSVKVDGELVAEVVSFDLTIRIGTIDDSAMGDEWESYITHLKGWSGTMNCHWDESDTDGQNALTIGTEVALSLGPEGHASGDTVYSGTAIVEEIGISASKDSVVSRNFTFRGKGPLVEAAVTP